MVDIRSEAEIEAEVREIADTAAVVKSLTRLVGVIVVATIGNANSEGRVRRWLNGERSDRDDRFRFALRLALMLAQHGGTGIAQAWFKGANAMLGNRSPAVVLRDDFSLETQRHLVMAARESTA